jgi:hypothetical protein
MTTPFPFTAGQTLTAAQMNAITELVINDKTASHTLTAADAGDYVVMNSASATTITVNTGIFTASQVVYIVNKGTASTVITAGAGVTISTSGSLTVPANGSGRLLALSASAFIYEAGGITASAGALTLISAGTFTSQNNVSLTTNTFSATHRNYRVFFETTAVSTTVNLTLRLRSSGSDVTSSGYYQSSPGAIFTGTDSNQGDNGTTSFTLGTVGSFYGGPSALVLDVISPKIATQHKTIVGLWSFANAGGNFIGRAFVGHFYAPATQTYDSLSFISDVASSITGITRVYGYGDS